MPFVCYPRDRHGKVLWVKSPTGAKPYLCVEVGASLKSFRLVDLEYCDGLTLLVRDIEHLVETSEVWWDDA
jgi:hypothetical protein